MVQGDPRGTAALGTAGGALGYAADDFGGSGFPGIVNSVAVEFDTFLNGVNDTTGNHVSVDINGVLTDTALIDPGFSLQNTTVERLGRIRCREPSS